MRFIRRTKRAITLWWDYKQNPELRSLGWDAYVRYETAKAECYGYEPIGFAVWCPVEAAERVYYGEEG